METGVLKVCLGAMEIRSLERRCWLYKQDGCIYAKKYDPKAPFKKMSDGTEIELTHTRMTLDTGAAQTTFPEDLVDSCSTMDAPKGSYKTASGEIIPDKGAKHPSGYDAYGNLRKFRGRVAPVHKPLVSASKVCDADNDIWLGSVGGYIVPKHGTIGVEMRKHFEQLVQKHSMQSLIPVYLHNGVFVFDYFLAPSSEVGDVQTSEQPLAPVDEAVGGQQGSGFTRLESHL